MEGHSVTVLLFLVVICLYWSMHAAAAKEATLTLLNEEVEKMVMGLQH